MKIALIGYGKMGRAIEKELLGSLHTIVAKINSSSSDFDWKNAQNAEVWIEFSHPSAVLKNTQRAAELKIPMVIGTTGWQHQKLEVQKMSHENDLPIIYGANFSVGVTKFFELVKRASEILLRDEKTSLSINETHHKEKIDAPSGTALLLKELLENASGFNNKEFIKIVSHREKGVFGQHEVSFKTESDLITLQHAALNRSCFAKGAIKAAEWIVHKKGFYHFKEMVFECV